MEWKRFALAMVGHFLSSLLYVLRRLRLINAVVDTSSILEHREEIRELWEKRMMADDNLSSPSSVTTETKTEEGHEEAVVKATFVESEMKPEEKLSNGSAKVLEEATKDANENHVHEEEATKKDAAEDLAPIKNDDHDNTCTDSLDEDNADEYVEEKTYVSETSLVMKSETVEKVKNEEIVQTTTTVEEHVLEPLIKDEVTKNDVVAPETISEDSIDAGVTTVEEVVVSSTPSMDHVPFTESKEVVAEESKEADDDMPSKSEVLKEEHTKESTDKNCIKAFEIPDCTDEDGDGFVRIGECLPIGDNVENIPDVLSESTEREAFDDSLKNGLTNGHHPDDHPSSPSLPPTPDSALSEKLLSGGGSPPAEMDQFVKSGGLKRVLVQKTEQPYSSCTTETKIAMEIREMREREEELRVMRERAPVTVSPVMTPTTPSPTPKESGAVSSSTPSPVPNGCGYRVSSVFGHRGSPASPSSVAEEEKRSLKGAFAANKESAVEKEIRLARDREEELRKQKGLPPREDDSYVKPSQVKSSQVRVFGKMVGANNQKQAATAKIQLEIEEQTQREMALRDTGSIQTISQERTDAKVAKLKSAEVTKNGTANGLNGNSHPVTNGTNGRASPEKRGSPSPTGVHLSHRPAAIFSPTNGSGGGKANGGGISMHKFIASKGKEATFAAPAPRPFAKEEPRCGVVPPNMVKLKRTVSVESKIQQEIMEMKKREEELKLLHMNRSNDNLLVDQDTFEHEINQKNNFVDYENENSINDEDIGPRHNKLIAQWEQRCQKAES